MHIIRKRVAGKTYVASFALYALILTICYVPQINVIFLDRKSVLLQKTTSFQ